MDIKYRKNYDTELLNVQKIEIIINFRKYSAFKRLKQMLAK